MQKISETKDILKILFDPQSENKNISLNVRKKFLVYYLEAHWEEICGELIAKSSVPVKLENEELIVIVNNSMLANELFMMRSMFLGKLNIFLKGLVNIKNVHFKVGSLRKKVLQAEEEEKILPRKICPKCGCSMAGDLEICSCCEREERNATRQAILEILLLEPWLDYENCKNFVKCDKILFMYVKDNLKNHYFRNVALDIADDEEKLIAVMLLTGKSFNEMNEKIYNNALAYLKSFTEG